VKTLRGHLTYTKVQIERKDVLRESVNVFATAQMDVILCVILCL